MTHNQFIDFLNKCEATLDLTDFSKCTAFLFSENKEGEVANFDFLTDSFWCAPEIWINDVPVELTKYQKKLIKMHLENEIKDDLQQWREVKEDDWNVFNDQIT